MQEANSGQEKYQLIPILNGFSKVKTLYLDNSCFKEPHMPKWWNLTPKQIEEQILWTEQISHYLWDSNWVVTRRVFDEFQEGNLILEKIINATESGRGSKFKKLLLARKSFLSRYDFETKRSDNFYLSPDQFEAIGHLIGFAEEMFCRIGGKASERTDIGLIARILIKSLEMRTGLFSFDRKINLAVAGCVNELKDYLHLNRILLAEYCGTIPAQYYR